MKILLVAINAKYVQTNLAVRLLKAYAEKWAEPVRDGRVSVETAEWNINQPHSAMIRGIYESGAAIVLFSTYIWNRDAVFAVAAGVGKVMPDALVGLGGPEVSWSPAQAFADCPDAGIIIAGEGEETFAELVVRAGETAKPDRPSAPGVAGAFSGIRGLYARDSLSGSGFAFGGERAPIGDLGRIPFPYDFADMGFDSAHRIVYYESSRGCPFSCAYCLSAIDKSVRYYPLERVLGEIRGFMDAGIPLVKFVDRTFNLDPGRYLAIWAFIRDNHNGKTLFHFEIAAEYLSDEAFAVLETMPEGAIQLEVGIQSTNPETLRIVGRPAHPAVLAEKILRIPERLHTHVDLIAGLPDEDHESFARSFDFAFALDADMLQLGFLKILSGTPMEKMARNTPGYVWSSAPPYEVLSTPVLTYAEMLKLKDAEQVLDTWYNSALMRNTMRFLGTGSRDGREPAPAGSAFSLFRAVAEFTRGFFADGDLYLPRRPSDSFACMAAFVSAPDRFAPGAGKHALEWLRYDFLLQGKPGAFPPWYERRYSKEAHDRALGAMGLTGLPGLTGTGAGTEAVSRRTLYSRTEWDIFRFDAEERETPVLFVYPDKAGNEKRTKVFRVVPGDVPREFSLRW